MLRHMRRKVGVYQRRRRGDYVASHAKKSWGVPEKEASDDCAYPSFEGRIEKLARAIAPPATHS